MYNSIIISDSDSTITYQIQARDPRPCCVSLLEQAHKLFGLSLHAQPNTVTILALIKCPMQNLTLPPLPRAILSGLPPAYREFKTQKIRQELKPFPAISIFYSLKPILHLA